MEQKLTYWLLTDVYSPSETATAYLLTDVVNFLKKRNIRLRVVTNSSGESSDVVIRLKPFSRVVSNNLSLVIRSFFLVSHAYWRARPGDIILIVTNPPFLLLFTAILSVFKKVTTVAIIHDVFPDNHIIIDGENIISKCLLKPFKWAYKRMDICVAIGRDMKEVLLSKGVADTKVSYIPNWTVSRRYSQLSSEVKCLNPTLLYAGNIGPAQGLNANLIEIDYSLSAPLKIDLYGNGKALDQLLSHNFKYVTINYNGGFTKVEEESLYSKYSIAIISLKAGMYGLGVPSKFYSLINYNLVILYIGDRDSELYRLIKVNDIGWAFDAVSEKNQLNEFFSSELYLNSEIISCKRKNLEIFRINQLKDDSLNSYYKLLNNLK